MSQRSRVQGLALAVSAAVVTAGVSSCGSAVSDAYVIEGQPGTVEPIEGTDLARVTLTARAAERLRIETAPVEESGRAVVVPEKAIFVDSEGAWWVYTSQQRNAFVRHQIVIERQRGGHALLSEGPRAGTEVVTVGVAELYGLEAGIAH
jgi:hypothetical protein